MLLTRREGGRGDKVVKRGRGGSKQANSVTRKEGGMNRQTECFNHSREGETAGISSSTGPGTDVKMRAGAKNFAQG